MITVRFAERLVSDFWARVGQQEPFPRFLERAISTAAPVFVVKVHRHRLDSEYIRNWLRNRDVSLPTPWKERRLNGCLVAYRGEAAIFVDGTLNSEESRIIIAHEFGHYLAEYEWPRHRARRRLGPSVLQVLDGDRPPTSQEKIAAVLADVPLGVYVHYMDRPSEAAGLAMVSDVEGTADVVATELLAPRALILAHLAISGGEDACIGLLETRFGLPRPYAESYARRLACQGGRKKSFSEFLGL